MRTEEARLLSAAAELARAHPPRHAVILDLSGVLHIDEPVFHRTLTRWLRGQTGGAPAAAGPGEGEPGDLPQATSPLLAAQQRAGSLAGMADRAAGGVDSYELAHGRLCLIIDDTRLPAQRAALAHVAGILAEHRRGSIHARWFDLSREGEGFAAAVRALVEEATAGDRPGDLPVGGELDRFLALERSLHAVDLSGLIRQHPIQRVEPGGVPQVVMLELTVSLQELERMFQLDLLREPWLYSRVTELLDRRMLFHLARDRDRHPLPLAVKLHAGTVAGEEFSRRIGQLPARLHGRLVVELPYLEWVADRALVVQAIAMARRHEIAVAMDHVPMAAVTSGDLPEVDLYRLHWMDDEGHRSDLAQAGPWVAKLGVERCLLARCTEPQAVVDGLAAGIRLFQGRAVDRLAADQARAAAEKRAEELVREEARAGTAGPAPGDAPAAGARPAGRPGWLRRLFGGTTPAAAGDSAVEQQGRGGHDQPGDHHRHHGEDGDGRA